MDALPWQRRIARSFTLQVALIGSVLLFMWLTEAADTFLFRGGLDQFGVWPHHLLGLRGILFAPFLHANFAHLATNSVPFAFLGWLILVRGWSDYLIVTLVVMVSSGLGAGFSVRPTPSTLAPVAWSSVILASCCCGPSMNAVLLP